MKIALTLKTGVAKSDSSQSLRVSPDVLWQRLDDEVIVIQLKTDQIFSLNHTGARFWELLSGGSDLASIRAEMESEFDVAPDTLAAEIDKTLALLISEQLLIAMEP